MTKDRRAALTAEILEYIANHMEAVLLHADDYVEMLETDDEGYFLEAMFKREADKLRDRARMVRRKLATRRAEGS